MSTRVRSIYFFFYHLSIVDAIYSVLNLMARILIHIIALKHWLEMHSFVFSKLNWNGTYWNLVVELMWLFKNIPAPSTGQYFMHIRIDMFMMFFALCKFIFMNKMLNHIVFQTNTPPHATHTHTQRTWHMYLNYALHYTAWIWKWKEKSNEFGLLMKLFV